MMRTGDKFDESRAKKCYSDISMFKSDMLTICGSKIFTLAFDRMVRKYKGSDKLYMVEEKVGEKYTVHSFVMVRDGLVIDVETA